jgi:HD-like signal output (HDOD) protein
MHNADERQLVDAILASGVKIPAMPSALLDVVALLKDGNAGPREFAAKISTDPALAGALFRVAGSPVLGLRKKVDSLEKAVTVLGLRTTVAVVRSEALHNVLNDPGLAAVMNPLWRRMNDVAELVTATVRLVRPRGIAEDLAFQAGTFHDCGIALLARRDAAYARDFAQAAGWPDLLALDHVYSANHAVVGQMVARSWQLPPDVVLAVRNHHDRAIDALPEAVRKLITLIQFACHLLAVRAGDSDGEWDATWREQADGFFREAGHELPDLEERLLSPAP